MGLEGMRLALAGDTMLGRGVAAAIRSGREPLLDPELVALARTADLFIVNLECCISERGEPWHSPGKPFFFRAPPQAAQLLAGWGVHCVTLANNHALDYGRDALLDTFGHLRSAGVAWAGAGRDRQGARGPLWIAAGGRRVALIAASDHPARYAAGPTEPGIAYADLQAGVPGWLTDALAQARDADAALCTVHWGPNMTTEPPAYVRRAARRLRDAGATLAIGHSAHVPHGAADRILYDVGDFLDDYAVDPELRNDLGLLFLVELDRDGCRAEAVPLMLDYCHTRLAEGSDARLVADRFARACVALGGDAELVAGRVRFRLA
jgi:Bacterial capsule synthesis protein PGA_cap